jgi:hypothetical protein
MLSVLLCKHAITWQPLLQQSWTIIMLLPITAAAAAAGCCVPLHLP